MALPANAKIAAFVCRGRSRPYESGPIPGRNCGNTSFRATISPTRNATRPHPAVAIANFRTIALSYRNVSTRASAVTLMGSTFLSGNLSVVEQHTDSRRAGVVVLAGHHRPRERAEETGGDGPARHDQQHDDAHTGSILLADHRIAPALTPTTVSELTGIRIAAASGVSAPASASERPSAL